MRISSVRGIEKTGDKRVWIGTASVLIFLSVAGISLGFYKNELWPRYSEQVLFKGDGDYYYRIPGIVSMDSGIVIAYCEKRAYGSTDWGNITIVYRRSKNGRDWDDEKVLVKNTEGVTYNNPVMIVDHQGGLHCILCREYGVVSRGAAYFI